MNQKFLCTFSCINSKPVEFRITDNNELPHVLQHNGSMIIYNESGCKISYTSYATSTPQTCSFTTNDHNYIYVADNVIASGYGFSDLTTRNKLYQISYEFDPRIDYTYQCIHNTCDYVQGNFVKSYEGDISYTYIKEFADNTYFTEIAKDLFMTPYQYSYASYGNIETIVSTRIENIDDYDTSTSAYYPVGTYLRSANTYINVSQNDASYVNASYNANYYNNSGMQLYSYIGAQLQQGKIHLSYNYATEPSTMHQSYYCIKYGENIIFDSIDVSTGGSVHKPYNVKYPELYSCEYLKPPYDFTIPSIRLYGYLSIPYTTYLNGVVQDSGQIDIMNFSGSYEYTTPTISNFNKIEYDTSYVDSYYDVDVKLQNLLTNEIIEVPFTYTSSYQYSNDYAPFQNNYKLLFNITKTSN